MSLKYFYLLLALAALFLSTASFSLEKALQSPYNDAVGAADERSNLGNVLSRYLNEDRALRVSKKSLYAKRMAFELCFNVNCHRLYSNGQVSKSWRIAQLVTCCPELRNKKNMLSKKRATADLFN